MPLNFAKSLLGLRRGSPAGRGQNTATSIEDQAVKDVEDNIRNFYFPQDGRLKIVLVGDAGQMKTRLIKCYSSQQYPTVRINSVFENFQIVVNAGGEDLTLGLWDTTGQQDYDRLRPLSYPNTDMFLICTDVNDEASFDNVTEKWLPEISHFSPRTPFIIVCLRDSPESEEEFPEETDKQTHNRQYGAKIAQDLRVKYVDCDLEVIPSVNEVFYEAIITALEQKRSSSKVKRNKMQMTLRRADLLPIG